MEEAARQGEIAKQKGLGASLERKILSGLDIQKQAVGKRHIHRAAQLLGAAKERIQRGRLGQSTVTITGDLRRGCELVADMSIVAVGPGKTVNSVEASGDIILTISPPTRFGSALLFATGSSAHLDALKNQARIKGMTLTKHGLSKGKQFAAARTEREIYFRSRFAIHRARATRRQR